MHDGACAQLVWVPCHSRGSPSRDRVFLTGYIQVKTDATLRCILKKLEERSTKNIFMQCG